MRSDTKAGSGAAFFGTLAVVAGLFLASQAQADPCGMVPPVWIPEMTEGQPALERQGDQITYAFFKDGVETMVLRPGFSGNVDEFGMLIPFPSPPAIRKTADDTFPHLAAAVDAPQVNVHIYEEQPYRSYSMKSGAMDMPAAEVESEKDDGLRFDEVRVLNQEAVGMYEVAVLEAGSSAALDVWMTDHQFQYPAGMDAVVDDYVDDSWVFVAIKAKVGSMPGVAPVPGMTGVDATLPAGASFDGHVQGMGFRFETDEPVIPMRMAAFNGATERNLVYFLADKPLKIAELPAELVVRQVPGSDVYTNVTDLLPMTVTGGTLTKKMTDDLAPQRDPSPYNGIARELFAADLLSAKTGKLSLPFEEYEKELLVVSESLGLRGPEIDAAHHVELETKKDAAVGEALVDLRGMTLTVIDGDLDAVHTAAKNITFDGYAMASAQNTASAWSRRPAGPTVYMSRDGGWWGEGWFPW